MASPIIDIKKIRHETQKREEKIKEENDRRIREEEIRSAKQRDEQERQEFKPVMDALTKCIQETHNNPFISKNSHKYYFDNRSGYVINHECIALGFISKSQEKELTEKGFEVHHTGYAASSFARKNPDEVHVTWQDPRSNFELDSLKKSI